MWQRPEGQALLWQLLLNRRRPFAAWQADYQAVAPNPDHFLPFLERMQPVAHDWPGWTDDEIRSVTAPTLLVIGDQDFVRLDHAGEMLDLFPDCRLAVPARHEAHRGHAAIRAAPGARRVLPGLTGRHPLASRSLGRRSGRP